MTATSMTKKDAEKLKDWLEEALKPRFEVRKDGIDYDYAVIDTKDRLGKFRAKYYKDVEFDAKKEAEALCERLNKEC